MAKTDRSRSSYLYPSSSLSCPFAGPQDSSSLLVAMTGYHLHTSGNTLTLCVAMCSVYAILKLIIIVYRLLVITAFLGLAYLRTLLVDCGIPARPVSKGRRHAQSSNVSEDEQASTRMFHQCQSCCHSPIILCPTAQPFVSDGFLNPGRSWESSVSFLHGLNDRQVPRWSPSWSPNLNRAWCPFSRPFLMIFLREIWSQIYLGLPWWTWGLLTVT
jgi:hypothetical protein